MTEDEPIYPDNADPLWVEFDRHAADREERLRDRLQPIADDLLRTHTIREAMQIFGECLHNASGGDLRLTTVDEIARHIEKAQ